VGVHWIFKGYRLRFPDNERSLYSFLEFQFMECWSQADRGGFLSGVLSRGFVDRI